jgi:hypothetical protein
MLQEPKSGREVEVAFMPEHIAIRLADYIASRNLSPNDRVFGVCCTTARNLRMSVNRQAPFGDTTWQMKICKEFGLESEMK